MKNPILVILVNFIFISLNFAQDYEKSNFFEFGARTGKFIESTFLEDSKYKNQLSDPATESTGFMVSATGRIYAAKFRYGIEIFTKIHFIVESGFVSRNEQVIYFCHACDLASIPSTLTRVNSFDIGTGIRYQLFELNKFKLLIEGIGNYSISSNESGIRYFGYSIHPLIGYNFGKKLSVNLKFGFEQSFGDYEKKERYFEFAINYQIKKNPVAD